MPQVMAIDDMQRVIRRISHEILETHGGAEGLLLVGVHTRGVPFAERLGQTISEFENTRVDVGALDIGTYRDDRQTRLPAPAKETEIPVSVDSRHVIIVDDVLYTGRTVRACLDALTDMGRADTIEVAVMVDRGHRELPIRADYVGKNVPTSQDEMVRVRFQETDGEDSVWIRREGR